MLSRFFIDRPNFAWVIAIFITLVGVLSITKLPISQFPDVAPPQITISATYPGASAELINESVTSVIEEELSGAKGMLYFESSSTSTGTADITVTFAPGTDPDLAQVDVQNRLKRAESRLPTPVTQLGVGVEQASAGFLMIYTLSYEQGANASNTIGLYDYAARSVNNEIARVPGVGRVQFFGAEPAMRVWISPKKLLSYNLSMPEVTAAIAAQNVQVPAGSFGAEPGTPDQELTATLSLKGTLDTPEEFGRIVLRSTNDGSVVRLSDVARLEIGQENYGFAVRLNGQPAVGAAVQLAPGANAIETVKGIKSRLEELKGSFPANVKYDIPYDTSTFVGVAIKKVVMTLFEAIVLVFLVMFLFLQNWRYTLIPSIVVPVCLLGTFGVMLTMGISINMMTMFGMVLAIGILVDDAIVVVENVERLMTEEGLSPKDATVKAMQQVSGAIVGITLVLVAVFLPMAFMSGSVGVIYKQFSIALSVSIAFSGFLALTFTPALCATLLKPVAAGEHAEKRGFFGWFNRKFESVSSTYSGMTSAVVRKTGRWMLFYVGVLALLVVLFIRLPQTFVPSEDQGNMMVSLSLPAGATQHRTEKAAQQMESYLMGRESVQSVLTIIGFSFSGSGPNAAMGFATFKDWSKRGKEQSAEAETQALNEAMAGAPDGTFLAVVPPSIQGLGTSGGFSFRLQDRGGLGAKGLADARDELLAEAAHDPDLLYAMQEGLEDAPQLRLDVDRTKAEALNVSFETVASALSAAYGSQMIGDFVNKGRLQRVVLQADATERMTPEHVLSLRTQSRDGKDVPISAFVTARWENAPQQLSRFNGYPAYKISGEAAAGKSSGSAMAAMERVAGDLPSGIGYDWSDLSYQEKSAGAQAPLVLGMSFVIVFLVLVALYESWSIPMSVMLVVPVGAVGSVLAVTLLGMENDVYFKVGLITIIGLSAKNAILIIEFAKDIRAQGKGIIDSVLEAAHLRFRPIVMTSLAFILGVVPMAIASGAGAASQRALGVGVIGGMLTATCLGVFLIPVFYVWLMELLEKRKARKSKANSEAEKLA